MCAVFYLVGAKDLNFLPILYLLCHLSAQSVSQATQTQARWLWVSWRAFVVWVYTMTFVDLTDESPSPSPRGKRPADGPPTTDSGHQSGAHIPPIVDLSDTQEEDDALPNEPVPKNKTAPHVDDLFASFLLAELKKPAAPTAVPAAPVSKKPSTASIVKRSAPPRGVHELARPERQRRRRRPRGGGTSAAQAHGRTRI